MQSCIQIHTSRMDWGPIRLLLSVRILPSLPTLNKQKSILISDADSKSQTFSKIFYICHIVDCYVFFLSPCVSDSKRKMLTFLSFERQSLLFSHMTADVRSEHELFVPDDTKANLPCFILTPASAEGCCPWSCTRQSHNETSTEYLLSIWWEGLPITSSVLVYRGTEWAFASLIC